MQLIHITGDLVELAKVGYFDAIIHGANCIHNMGAGIAKQIATEFPVALSADLNTPRGYRGKLGSFSSAVTTIKGKTLFIYNAYTQPVPGPTASVGAISSAIHAIISSIDTTPFPPNRIGLPRIGCGLGGLQWEDVEPVLEKVARDSRTFLHVVTLPGEGR